ncbi:exodeoxyribonuclease V subunit alpha [Desulfosoma caldarium]|uniref:DNA helicase/exodeoxyribonuclease V alpha subunit n=1 Tax=Desulfosoma caldarium TaxID=610254 RepID=A0A3N1VL86_9BACT|nr:exodeoxyribonuclease V subunit alpha [Desulfosoma caldarium]ROR01778.1 DNA helicase/exodeoxyribonuclease V alpha subunit [Desulfosoma caldarium]
MENGLEALDQLGTLRSIDRCFAQWVAARDSDGLQSAVGLAAALASLRLSHGDVCVDLQDWAGKPLFYEARTSQAHFVGLPLDNWLDALAQSQAVYHVNANSTPATSIDQRPLEKAAVSQAAMRPDGHEAFVPTRPLVLDGTRLYLARYWFYECDLARRLRKVAEGWIDLAPQAVRAAIEAVFSPVSQDDAIDWQRVATAVAAMKRLCIISGGPGTGKTHTVACILAVLHQLHGQRPPRIALAAPTGKAAARITESLRQSPASFAHRIPWKENFPKEAMTLHRLLGVRQGRAVPRHSPENPLHLDVLIVDEASMIDLPLMAHTAAALPPHARLILLGDKDQLASVEAGHVFSDLCGRLSQGLVHQKNQGLIRSREWMEKLQAVTGMTFPESSFCGVKARSPLSECTVFLEKNYRFPPHSPLGRLAASIRAGAFDAEVFKGKPFSPPKVLPRAEHAEVRWRWAQEHELFQALSPVVNGRFQKVACAESLQEAFGELDSFRILCAVREGPYGVMAINDLVETALARCQRIPAGARAYKGRPVLILENDYRVGLFNGDVGLLWPDPEDNRLKAWFRKMDGTLHKVPLSRLPAHETAYAMTVHKSQGSEFSHVLVILPDRHVSVLTRELLYTAVTRARDGVEIWAHEDILKNTLQRVTQRRSGLGFRLWGGP